MNINRHINRFRAWQRNPIQFSDQGLEEHCCANCQHTYTGNYCPVCGQVAGGKLYYYFTYRQLLGNRLGGTLWHLLPSMVTAFWIMALSTSIVLHMVSSTLNATGFFRALAIIVALLSAGYLISRRTAKNRQATNDN